MIIRDEDQIELRFGSGDICINPGTFTQEEKQGVGVVAFSNQSARKIGKDNGDIIPGQEYDLNNFPVIMTFYKKESIDMVMSALLETKALMDD